MIKKVKTKGNQYRYICLNVPIDPDDYRRLKAHQEGRSRTLSKLVRRYIEEGMARDLEREKEAVYSTDALRKEGGVEDRREDTSREDRRDGRRSHASGAREAEKRFHFPGLN